MSVAISSLVFPTREYGGNTLLGVAVGIQVKSVANKKLESWGCYKVASEPTRDRELSQWMESPCAVT